MDNGSYSSRISLFGISLQKNRRRVAPLCLGLDVGERLQVWYDFLNGGKNHDPVQVPAGTYTPVSHSWVEIGGMYALKEDDAIIGIAEQIPRYFFMSQIVRSGCDLGY